MKTSFQPHHRQLLASSATPIVSSILFNTVQCTCTALCVQYCNGVCFMIPCVLFVHIAEDLVKNLEIREPQGDEIWPKALRCSDQLTPTELSSPSMETDLLAQVERKKGRRKKSASEDQLIIDGQFEVPPSIDEPSSEVTTINVPPTSSVAVLTTESDLIPLRIVGMVPMPPQVSVSEQQSTSPSSKHQTPITTQKDKSQLDSLEKKSPKASPSALRSETVETPQQTDTAKQFQIVRRSLRKRTPKKTPPLKSTSAKIKTKNQKSTNPLPNTDNKNSSSTATPKKSKRSKGVATPWQEKQDLMSWSVEDVVAFVASIPRCNYSSTFKEHVSIIIIIAAEE